MPETWLPGHIDASQAGANFNLPDGTSMLDIG
jgi:hypothetical protein